MWVVHKLELNVIVNPGLQTHKVHEFILVFLVHDVDYLRGRLIECVSFYFHYVVAAYLQILKHDPSPFIRGLLSILDFIVLLLLVLFLDLLHSIIFVPEVADASAFLPNQMRQPGLHYVSRAWSP